MTEATAVETRHIVYDDGVVRSFVVASLFWGAVGLLLGVIAAAQLTWWQANLSTSYLAFGRLRPLHTNAAIFAFVGNMMFAGIYHSSQRLLKTRMASDLLSRIHFWGWQVIIVAAAVSLLAGLTQGKEYAELIWPIDLLVVLVWVAFGINYFWTLAIRNEKNLYVAIWFYIATIVTIAVLYIVNNLQLPIDFLHSYSIYGGVQDALVEWWYGHNAVGFFLTTPILGIMYYYLPKAVNRPVYSYRLSIVHFWALIFVYIWAGPHHLLNTSLPNWAQTLGMVFSLMLWAPSWGGMLNGLLTLRGAWDKLRTDPVVKFLIVAITFYGMSTFEGPMLAIKSVNGLAHYTDWIIAHVHGGTLGWNGFMAAGMFYWLVPRLWNTKLHSARMAEAHFWIGTFGILLYVVSMWISGINQGLYWRALDGEGFLKYPDFIEGLLSARVLYMMRLFGGMLYLGGHLMMLGNLVATMRAGRKVGAGVDVVVSTPEPPVPAWVILRGAPVVISAAVIVLGVLLGIATPITTPIILTFGVVIIITAFLIQTLERKASRRWHRMLEGRSLVFTFLVLLAILVGGVAELIPTLVIERKVPPVTDLESEGADVEPLVAIDPEHIQKPYSPLELEGRDVYIREGCYNCHSQMIRPFRHETLRYGAFSRLEEAIYDHPFQFGSKRTGPDLHRVGGKYPNLWHYQHLIDPRSTSPGSNMPNYPWLKHERLDYTKTRAKISAMRRLGVPYTEEAIRGAEAAARAQADGIVADLATRGVEAGGESRLIALIAYLQRLGRGPQFDAASKKAEGR